MHEVRVGENSCPYTVGFPRFTFDCVWSSLQRQGFKYVKNTFKLHAFSSKVLSDKLKELLKELNEILSIRVLGWSTEVGRLSERQTKGLTGNECQEPRILNHCCCCSDSDLWCCFRGIGEAAKENKNGSTRRGIPV